MNKNQIIKHTLQVRRIVNNTYISHTLILLKTAARGILFRGCHSVLLLDNQKGQASVELALLLPIFLIAFYSIFLIGQVYMLEEQVYAAFQQTALDLSEQAYLIGEHEVGEIAVDTLATTSFLTYEKEIKNVKALVKGGAAGFSFLHSTYDEKCGEMDLILRYAVKVNVPFMRNVSFPIYERARIHTWVGNADNRINDDEYVYITDNQAVYHTRRDCSYLALSISAVTGFQIDHSSYGACEYCAHTLQPSARYYVTEYGQKYHESLDCVGLKRTVYKVKKEDVNKGACSRCGK